jgi:hypothetical protein
MVVFAGEEKVHLSQLPEGVGRPVPPNWSESELLGEQLVAVPLSHPTIGLLAELVHPSVPVHMPLGVVHEWTVYVPAWATAAAVHVNAMASRVVRLVRRGIECDLLMLG